MELLLEKVAFSRWRRKVFDSLDGDIILEVGVGTGKNLDFYPVGKPITAIDFSQGMLSRARRKAESRGLKVDLVDMDAQDRRFADQSFDTVLATFVFCSVPDPIRGFREIKRVCKKGGKIVLLEHVRPGSTLLGKIFDLLNPITVKLMGVNINRDTIANMERADGRGRRLRRTLEGMEALVIFGTRASPPFLSVKDSQWTDGRR
jgi:ubiquinone/menaquinone biosynthesis C-methylase UbiE